MEVSIQCEKEAGDNQGRRTTEQAALSGTVLPVTDGVQTEGERPLSRGP